ncbi:hypothetical protein INR49_007472 [Caranx melampygus]|nr:hypothetical protein INR49_007472 [Caranx melampygus]
MAASNYSLKVNRELLDPSFESYRLSLEPTPCYTVELDAVVEEVKLKDSHYTLEHMQAFGMYNYLHLDPWYEDSVLFVDCKGRVLSLTVTLVSSSSSSIVLPLMFMSLWISCLSAHCQRSCVSIGHDSDDVTLGFRSDGRGRAAEEASATLTDTDGGENDLRGAAYIRFNVRVAAILFSGFREAPSQSFFRFNTNIQMDALDFGGQRSKVTVLTSMCCVCVL